MTFLGGRLEGREGGGVEIPPSLARPLLYLPPPPHHHPPSPPPLPPPPSPRPPSHPPLPLILPLAAGAGLLPPRRQVAGDILNLRIRNGLVEGPAGRPAGFVPSEGFVCGFPCPPWSFLGKKAGMEDERAQGPARARRGSLGLVWSSKLEETECEDVVVDRTDDERRGERVDKGTRDEGATDGWRQRRPTWTSRVEGLRWRGL
eukprot:9492363-Pyramimonas_sp.AAC.1